MKYHTGKTVILLDTEYKPAGNAVICGYDEDTHKYEVDFTYYGKSAAEKISVPEERLIEIPVMVA